MDQNSEPENSSLIREIERCAQNCHRIALSKGWWDKDRNDGELLMLMVTELAEACEGLRHGNPPSDHIPAFTAVEEELSDCMVRILDMSAARGYRIGEALVAKIAFNESREFRHGGKKF
jgi:NTP pyrophosphatase (non-canonical NTP hydrolase)